MEKSDDCFARNLSDSPYMSIWICIIEGKSKYKGGVELISGLNYKGNKSCRMLNLNERLIQGAVVNKSMLALEFGVTEKTIQRDIDSLRNYYAETHVGEGKVEIKYDKKRKGYKLIEW